MEFFIGGTGGYFTVARTLLSAKDGKFSDWVFSMPNVGGETYSQLGRANRNAREDHPKDRLRTG